MSKQQLIYSAVIFSTYTLIKPLIHSIVLSVTGSPLITMSFDPASHFNRLNFVSSDFYSPTPPAEVNVHSEPINLSGGRPNAGFYPIEAIELTVRDKPFDSDQTSKIFVKQSDETSLDVANAFQYGPPKGHPELIAFIKSLIAQVNPQPHSREIDHLLTTGSGDSLFKLMEVFLNPGETILVEEYTYTPIFAPIEALGGIKVPYTVKFETGGSVIDLEYLSNLLDNWETLKPDLPKPKLIYTVTTQNPSGLTQPLSTRQGLYAIAQKHDLVILEDDPDSYIRLNNLENYETYRESLQGGSYFNLDTDGRVVHFETFSKLYSPGIRLGFIVALKPIIDRLTEVSKIATKAPSGISQIVLYNTLKLWGQEFEGDLVKGYLNWDYKVSQEYSKRWSFVYDILKNSESLKNGYISLVVPDGGMFFVIKVNFPESPSHVGDLEKLRYKLLSEGVLVILGNLMAFENDISSKASFVRLTLANVDNLDVLKEGVERLDRGLLGFFNELTGFK